MNVQLAIQSLAFALIAAGLGLWQVGFVRERGLWRTVAVSGALLSLAVLVVSTVLVLIGIYAIDRVKISFAVALATIAAAAITSGAGRLRLMPALLLTAAFAAALPSLISVMVSSHPAIFFGPLASGSAAIGMLAVLGQRGRETRQSNPWIAAAGVPAFLIGLALLGADTTDAKWPLYFTLVIAAGLIAAAPLAWLLRGRNPNLLIPAAVAAGLVGTTADTARPEALACAAAAGALTCLIGALLNRLKIDDATGAASAFVAAGAAWMLVPTQFDLPYLPHLLGNALLLGAALVICVIAGFLLALLLQVTIGLRAPKESGEIPPELVKPR